MANLEQRRGSVRRLAQRIAPGLETLSRYQRSWLPNDLASGLSVAAIALPVGIAYSALAGVPPVVGMYSAIFPLLAYAIFGSSRQLMTGPDAATCIMVAASLGALAAGDSDRYLALLTVLTLMTGVLYVVAGIARLGFIANFLSQPILAGYLNGIALIIIVGQLPKLFGYADEATGFFPKLLELADNLDKAHIPTAILGAAMLVLLVLLRTLLPRVPGALVVVVAGIVTVWALTLENHGVAVLGEVPAGLPVLHFALLDADTYKHLFRDAAGIMLISFTSGVLTSKSFARRNGYDIDANQELIGFGACNIASGLAQGFPVTGADSRTAVNSAMGGKSQLAGIVAAGAMLIVLFFLTAPLALVPHAALAAVIVVSAVGLFDWASLRNLYRQSGRELLLSLITTLGALVLGVLPGVLLAVGLALVWLLYSGSRPHDEILGRMPGVKGFHSIRDYPEAATIPGLLLYRFDADLVFYNADYFKQRVHEAIAAAKTPIEWVVVDASPINIIDVTAIQKIDELRAELNAQGIVLAHARAKHNLARFFRRAWAKKRLDTEMGQSFPTIKAAVQAFRRRPNPTPGAMPGYSAD